MPSVDDIKAKVQRILTSHGTIRIDKDGDFVLQQDSAVLFIRVEEGFGDAETIVSMNVPLILEVQLTPALYEWAAVEGQHFRIGGVNVNKRDGNKSGDIWFHYSLVGDDIDESELMTAVFALLFTCDDLDNDLQKRFGGRLFVD